MFRAGAQVGKLSHPVEVHLDLEKQTAEIVKPAAPTVKQEKAGDGPTSEAPFECPVKQVRLPRGCACEATGASGSSDAGLVSVLLAVFDF